MTFFFIAEFKYFKIWTAKEKGLLLSLSCFGARERGFEKVCEIN